jgi:hypothetical protein
MGTETDRKFDTWECYEDGITPKRITFEIRYKRAANAFDKVTFYTSCDNPKVYVEDGDITKLQEKVKEQVRNFYAAAWEPMLLVTFDPGSSRKNTPTACSLSINVTRYERAMIEGREAFRAAEDATFPGVHDSQGYSRNSKQIFYISPDAPSASTLRETHQYAVMKDTPESREKIFSLLKGFALLRERLMNLIDTDLEQKLVGFSLLQLGSGQEKS